MPVRSLSSSVLVWPDHTQVDKAVRAWVVEMARHIPSCSEQHTLGLMLVETGA